MPRPLAPSSFPLCGLTAPDARMGLFFQEESRFSPAPRRLDIAEEIKYKKMFLYVKKREHRLPAREVWPHKNTSEISASLPILIMANPPLRTGSWKRPVLFPTGRKRTSLFHDPVRKGGLAMINMSNDAEISDVFLCGHTSRAGRQCSRTGKIGRAHV